MQIMREGLPVTYVAAATQQHSCVGEGYRGAELKSQNSAPSDDRLSRLVPARKVTDALIVLDACSWPHDDVGLWSRFSGSCWTSAECAGNGQAAKAQACMHPEYCVVVIPWIYIVWSCVMACVNRQIVVCHLVCPSLLRLACHLQGSTWDVKYGWRRNRPGWCRTQQDGLWERANHHLSIVTTQSHILPRLPKRLL